MFCENCGNQMKDEARFCTKCGFRVVSDTPTPVLQQPVNTRQTPQPIQQAPSKQTQQPVEPRPSHVTQPDAPEKAKKNYKVIIGGCIGLAIVGIAVVIAVSFGMKGCSNVLNGNVSKVKNGALGFDETVKVGDALDNYKYFSNTSWKELTTEQNKKIVEYKGIYDVAELNKECNEDFKDREKQIIFETKDAENDIKKAEQKLNECKDANNIINKLNECYEGNWIQGAGKDGTDCDFVNASVCKCAGYCMDNVILSVYRPDDIEEGIKAQIKDINKDLRYAENKKAKAKNDVRDHCPKNIEYTIQFLMHPNDNAFEVGYQGYTLMCPNGKTKEYHGDIVTLNGMESIIELIYKNEKLGHFNCP